MEVDDFELFGEWKLDAPQLIAIVASDKFGRLLMQLRDDFDEVQGSGRWGLFGGHFESGESIEVAALREIKEELGLNLEPTDLEPVARYLTERDEKQVFVCAIKPTLHPRDISLGEGAGFAFLNRSQVMELDIVPSVRDFAHGYVLSPRG